VTNLLNQFGYGCLTTNVRWSNVAQDWQPTDRSWAWRTCNNSHGLFQLGINEVAES